VTHNPGHGAALRLMPLERTRGACGALPWERRGAALAWSRWHASASPRAQVSHCTTTRRCWLQWPLRRTSWACTFRPIRCVAALSRRPLHRAQVCAAVRQLLPAPLCPSALGLGSQAAAGQQTCTGGVFCPEHAISASDHLQRACDGNSTCSQQATLARARQVSVSTVGLVPQLRALAAAASRCQLAVSLHATTDELRDWLVPVNRRRVPWGEHGGPMSLFRPVRWL